MSFLIISGDCRAKTSEDKTAKHLHDRRRLEREEGQDGGGHGRREGRETVAADGAACLSRPEERRQGGQAAILLDCQRAKNQERRKLGDRWHFDSEI